MVTTNRVTQHLAGEVAEGLSVRATPSLVEMQPRVQGKCDFHIAHIRKKVYEVRVGRSADAIVNFRFWPDFMEDCGHSKAWRRLWAALRRRTGKDVKFELEHLKCAEEAMFLTQRVGDSINAWRLATGRADFPSAALIAQAVNLPEPMVRVALRDYQRAG
jgi:hypothetical protein